MTGRKFADRRPLAAEDIETGVGQLVPGGIITDDDRTRLIIELMSRDDDDSALAAKVLLADLLTMGMLEMADPEGSFRLTANEVRARCGASVPSDVVCIVTQERTGGLPLGLPIEGSPAVAPQPTEEQEPPE